MPSSSARCAQLPRATDKVPFYAALRKFLDYLSGRIPELDEAEIVFTVKLTNARKIPKVENCEEGSIESNTAVSPTKLSPQKRKSEDTFASPKK